jgi:hypothetical protein
LVEFYFAVWEEIGDRHAEPLWCSWLTCRLCRNAAPQECQIPALLLVNGCGIK